MQRFLSWRSTSRTLFSEKSKLALVRLSCPKREGEEKGQRRREETEYTVNLVGTANALVAFTGAAMSLGGRRGGRVPANLASQRFVHDLSNCPTSFLCVSVAEEKDFRPLRISLMRPMHLVVKVERLSFCISRYLATPNSLQFPNTGPEITGEGVSWNSSSFNSSNDRYIRFPLISSRDLFVGRFVDWKSVKILWRCVYISIYEKFDLTRPRNLNHVFFFVRCINFKRVTKEKKKKKKIPI